MKLAICQTTIVWENKQQNIEQAAGWCLQAARESARFICFPEMSFTGFSMNTSMTMDLELETVEAMKGLSKQYDLAIGFGWVSPASGTEGKAENHYTVVDKGKILCDYVKIHPFSYSGEQEYFCGGKDSVVAELDGIRIGLTICYDLRFPELYQELSKSAHLILVPANWPQKRRDHWKVLLQARAIENQCYMAGINCVGEIGGLYYSGDSCLVDPFGKKIVQSADMQSLQLCEIEKGTVDSCRKEFPLKQDRRQSLYRAYYEIE